MRDGRLDHSHNDLRSSKSIQVVLNKLVEDPTA